MNFPPGFISSLANCDGFDESLFTKAHEIPAPVSIRKNPSKQNHQFDNLTKLPWCSSGYFLESRPSFTLDPLFHAGTYYVQEASSMFLDHLIKKTCNLDAQLNVLDLSAAPGGKSTLLASLLSEDSLLVSNEVIRSRVNMLNENMIKWGNANVIVTNNDPADFSKLKDFFDVIVIDAPCSGSGLFRKDKNAVKEWSTENVAMCSRRQKRIVGDVFPTLKENGILIYSTCSYSKEENEEIIRYAIDNLKFELINPPNEFTGIIQNEFGFRFYPDKIKGEGFFISALKKVASIGKDVEINSRRFDQVSENEKEIVSKQIAQPEQFEYISFRDAIHIIPKKITLNAEVIQANLKVVNIGIEAGRIAGHDLIPAHALAMSNAINKNQNSIEVDKETALQYLRKNSIELSAEYHGWCLIRYQGFNLGWIKIIPGRVNNYYPTDWRIRNK